MPGNGKKIIIELKKILFIACLIQALVAAGQEDSVRKMIDYRTAFKSRKPGIMRTYTGIVGPSKSGAEKFDRFNTDFYWNSWLGNTNNVETHFYSLGHNINLMFDIPFGPKSRMGIAVGLGYSHFCVRHNGALYFYSDSLSTGMYTQLQQYAGPKRWINRTVFNLVEIPFEFRFRSLRERGKIKFYPGFKAGFIVENYHKWRIENTEFKELNFPDLNRIHYGPTLRLGLDNVMLFGYYDLAYLFTHPGSSKLQLFSVGISIGWF